MSYPQISFDRKSRIRNALKGKKSFEVTDVKGREEIAVKWLEAEIQNCGMTSLVYTNNRWLVVGLTLNVPAAAKFAWENTRSPDYEIRRGLVTAFIEVTYQKAEADELDKRRKKEIRKWSKLHKQGLTFDPSSDRRPETECEASDSPRLEVTNGSGETVLSIAKVPDPGLARWEDAKGAKGERSRISSLNSILSAVPDLEVARHVHSSDYMEVVIPPGKELAPAATNEGAFRGFFRGSNGQIEGQAQLFNPEQLQMLASGAVLWNIASIALAQKHLHDINKKLERISEQLEGISEQLEEISGFQREERFSSLEGTLRSFMQMKREIADYSFAHISTDAVASECIQLSKIERHISKDIARAIEELRSACGLGPEFDQGLNRVIMLLNELHLCVTATLYGCQITAITSEDPGWLDSRIDDIQDDVERLTGRHDETVEAILEALGKNGDNFDSLQMLSRLRSSGQLENIVSSVDKELATARGLIWTRSAPVSVLLKVNGGEIEGFAAA